MCPGCLFGAPAADPNLANKSCYEADPGLQNANTLSRVAGPKIQLEMSAFDAWNGGDAFRNLAVRARTRKSAVGRS